MKAAKKQAAEIVRKQKAIEVTKSPHLRRDYIKGVYRMKKELMTYCRYRGFNYREIMDSARGDKHEY